ncbi:hypothetical protein EW145_g994 [Phellinidium pouzarii]|uniref:Ubiquitin 3 binding protein But2 C-terminal domain-containing protein n=1 Tax=Phellinidium pouzarii TaxID=167371 RepID=A0A4S4LLQ0_9AGAM|nr:hypothetical protein EW145_g994 [Phellinidium pouzarii]
MRFALSTSALLVSLFSLALASPTTDGKSARIVDVGKRYLGCGAYALNSSMVEFLPCKASQEYFCVATDSTGCNLGDASKIKSLVVSDPLDNAVLGGSANVANVSFTCPSNGMASCSLTFNVPNSEVTNDFGIAVRTYEFA